MARTPKTVRAMLEDNHAPTAPLDDFLPGYERDANWWWTISCGHHQNLFDEAVERLAAAQAEVARLRADVATLRLDAAAAGADMTDEREAERWRRR